MKFIFPIHADCRLRAKENRYVVSPHRDNVYIK